MRKESGTRDLCKSSTCCYLEVVSVVGCSKHLRCGSDESQPHSRSLTDREESVLHQYLKSTSVLLLYDDPFKRANSRLENIIM